MVGIGKFRFGGGEGEGSSRIGQRGGDKRGVGNASVKDGRTGMRAGA